MLFVCFHNWWEFESFFSFFFLLFILYTNDFFIIVIHHFSILKIWVLYKIYRRNFQRLESLKKFFDEHIFSWRFYTYRNLSCEFFVLTISVYFSFKLTPAFGSKMKKKFNLLPHTCWLYDCNKWNIFNW